MLVNQKTNNNLTPSIDYVLVDKIYDLA